MIKNLQAKLGSAYRTTKQLLGLMMVWGLIFSVVTIGRLAVGFGYDDTLVSSSEAFNKAFAQGVTADNPRFWSVVNQAYDLEKPKILPNVLAWVFRLCGFKVVVIAERPAVDGDALKKEWRRLVPRGNFVFAGETGAKQAHLEGSNFVLFFGDSDSEMAEAKKAGVLAVRILRGAGSLRKEGYRPGSFGELTLPLSQY